MRGSDCLGNARRQGGAAAKTLRRRLTAGDPKRRRCRGRTFGVSAAGRRFACKGAAHFSHSGGNALSEKKSIN
ncbi:MAG: hypothetical protein DBY36_09645 [Clostridiales bacterium]|nr:MAG: hypothetical protein DBY36_09645 [Clostridiales bacterium]